MSDWPDWDHSRGGDEAPTRTTCLWAPRINHQILQQAKYIKVTSKNHQRMIMLMP